MGQCDYWLHPKFTHWWANVTMCNIHSKILFQNPLHFLNKLMCCVNLVVNIFIIFNTLAASTTQPVKVLRWVGIILLPMPISATITVWMGATYLSVSAGNQNGTSCVSQVIHFLFQSCRHIGAWYTWALDRPLWLLYFMSILLPSIFTLFLLAFFLCLFVLFYSCC